MKFLGKKKGFTLIEMLIVIVIIGVLASALIPRLGSARGKANDVARKADLQQIATALISYQIDNSTFPNYGAKAQPIESGQIYTDLKKGGMASIPTKDATIYTGFNGAASTLDLNASGYLYMPMMKNGGPNNGFILLARAETEGGANYLICNNADAPAINTDVDKITLCSSITLSASCLSSANNNTACTYNDKTQLKYMYKY